MVRNPITFRDLPKLVGIMLIMGAGLYLLAQIPFVYSFFIKITDVVEVLGRNIH